ncbi:MAG: hypothetical protein FVQ82_04675 [Planctomycetes bacterium]|nr:hypothetical protein [Planctomycetota bacterium]
MEFDQNILAETKKQMAILAIRHLEMVDARTLTIFQKYGIFDSIESELNREDILPILKKSKHPDRRDIGAGPLFCYLAKKEPPEANIVEVADLLFSTDVELREEALKYFNNLQDGELPLLTPRSRGILQALGGDVLSEEKQKWRDAAVAIYDVLEDDWYCSYAALKQCLSRNFTHGIEHHLTKVIRPTIPSVDSVMLGVWEASKQKEQIKDKIKQIVTVNSDIVKALDAYLMTLGHIPLASDLSIISLIDEWQNEYGAIENIWEVLWTWADSYNLPVPRYHVCMYFIFYPDSVSVENYGALWHEIAEVVSSSSNEADDTKWSHSWKLFSEIARHYCYHLEARLPYQNGERIASQAWWLALQVCKAFSSENEDIKRLRTDTFLPELAFSSQIWQIASPCIEPSGLQYLTLNNPSIFALSLQAMLFDKVGSIDSKSIDKDDLKKIGKALNGTLLTIYPPVLKDDAEITYAFDKSPLNLASKWIVDVDEDDEQKEMMAAFIVGIEKLVKSKSLLDILNKFPNSHSGDQVLIANYFRNMVFTENVPLDDIWKVIQDSDWREAAFVNSHPVVLELIVGAFNEIIAKYQDKWAYNLPHYYALACEKCEDKERESQLFSCIVYSSLFGNTVSGIQRLLKSENKQGYSDYVNYFRDFLEDAHKRAPEWVKTKVRPVLAALHL